MGSVFAGLLIPPLGSRGIGKYTDAPHLPVSLIGKSPTVGVGIIQVGLPLVRVASGIARA